MIDMMNESVKMEEPFHNYSFLDHCNYSMSHENDDSSSSSILREVLEYSELAGGYRTSSLGFMELLNMHDFAPPASTSSLFVFDPPPSLAQDQPSKQDPELLNAPPTPNSSSISSDSNDDHTNTINKELDGEEAEDDEEDDEDHTNNKTKKQLKPRKKAIQKRKREPRFAFMTKSEVDHLEDGYRWRKYGQKAVKNSAFPRSYYRCTSASCNVKKRVERCWNDPSIVVTTYEGQHTHPSPMMQRCPPASWHSPPPFSSTPQIPPPNYLTHPPQGQGQGFPFNTTAVAPPQRQQLLTDHGLLQDVVPSSLIIKKENN